MSNIVPTKIKLRKDTLENWNNNPYVILLDGEVALSTMSDGSIGMKVGDGTTIFKDLKWVNDQFLSEHQPLIPQYDGNGKEFSNWIIEGVDSGENYWIKEDIIEAAYYSPGESGSEDIYYQYSLMYNDSVVESLPECLVKQLNLIFTGNITAHRSRNRLINYILGEQDDKPLQPYGDIQWHEITTPATGTITDIWVCDWNGEILNYDIGQNKWSDNLVPNKISLECTNNGTWNLTINTTEKSCFGNATVLNLDFGSGYTLRRFESYRRDKITYAPQSTIDGNLAILTSDGNIKDSGKKPSDFVNVNHTGNFSIQGTFNVKNSNNIKTIDISDNGNIYIKGIGGYDGITTDGALDIATFIHNLEMQLNNK